MITYLPLRGTRVQFTTDDLQKPELLRESANEVACLLRQNFPTADFTSAGNGREEQQLSSVNQLIFDLGESIARCEKLETYITTNLFLFLAVDRAIPLIGHNLRPRVVAMFLRAYVACVMAFEENESILA